MRRPLTVAQAINAALARGLTDRAHPDVLVFGEDVAAKGGVYGVTKGLLGAPARLGCSTRCSTSRRSSASRWARR